MIKKFIAAILVLISMFGMLPTGSAWLPPEPWEDDFQYPVDGGILYFEKETGTLTKYRNTDSSVTELTLPEEIDGVAVTTIGYAMFSPWGADLTKITISKSIKTIEECGIAYCGSLESITIPANIETIGDRAFDCCSSMKRFEVDAENPYFSNDENGFLYNKEKTKLIQAALAFSGEYVAPEGLEIIGYCAFSRGKGLTAVTLPDSVIRLENCAFQYCSNLEKIRLSENLAYIGTYAFEQTHALTRIDLPDSLRYLEAGVFSGSGGLTGADIPEGVTKISGKTFFSCKAFQSVAIPKSVRTVEYSAFEYCSALTDVYYAGSKSEWERIDFTHNNEPLLNANIHFNCDPTVGLNGEFVRTDKLEAGDEVIIVCDNDKIALSSVKSASFNDLRGILIERSSGKITYAPEEIIWDVDVVNGEYVFSQNGKKLSLADSSTLLMDQVHDRWSLQSLDNKLFYVKNAGYGAYLAWMATSDWWQTTKNLDYWAADCVLSFYVNTSPTDEEEPTEPSEEPTEPSEEPTEPSEEPTEPSEEPTEPSEEPTEPSEEPTEPSEEPTEPSEEPTEPSEEPTKPSEEPTEPSEEPTEPIEPNEPETPTKNPFLDVKEEDYFYSPVLWAVENGITNGVTETRFAPEATCTRGQIVTFLWRANGSPEPMSTVSPFSDVNEDDYYFKAVIWAIEEGITLGVGGGRFAPNESCTRGQVVTFLWRSMGEPVPQNEKNLFSDVGEKDYYCKAVAWAVENGITVGVGGGKFAPDANCTRGQIVTFLCRAMT